MGFMDELKKLTRPYNDAEVDEYDLYVDGILVTSDNCVDILGKKDDEDGDVKTGFQGFLEGNHIPGGNVGRIVHDALSGVCQGRDANSNLLHAGNQEPLYLVSQIDERIIQGCCFGKGRDLQLLDNLRPVYKAQIDGCSADVDS